MISHIPHAWFPLMLTSVIKHGTFVTAAESKRIHHYLLKPTVDSDVLSFYLVSFSDLGSHGGHHITSVVMRIFWLL